MPEILDNFDDIRQYLNVPINITAQTKESLNSSLKNIEKYGTILEDTGQYQTIQDYI